MSNEIRDERPLDDLQFRAQTDDAGTDIPGEFEVGLFCEGEYAESVRIGEKRLRELRAEIDELLGEETAQEADSKMLGVLRDVAALLPSAGRMHPQDVFDLQTRVCDSIAGAAKRVCTCSAIARATHTPVRGCPVHWEGKV